MAGFTVINVPRDTRYGEIGQGIAQGANTIVAAMLRQRELDRKRKAEEAAARVTETMTHALQDVDPQAAVQRAPQAGTVLDQSMIRLRELQAGQDKQVEEQQKIFDERQATIDVADGTPREQFQPDVQVTEAEKRELEFITAGLPGAQQEHIQLTKPLIRAERLDALRSAMSDPDFAAHKDFAAINRLIADTIPEFGRQGRGEIKEWKNLVIRDKAGEILQSISIPRDTSRAKQSLIVAQVPGATSSMLENLATTETNREGNTRSSRVSAFKNAWNAVIKDTGFVIDFPEDAEQGNYTNNANAAKTGRLRARAVVLQELVKTSHAIYKPVDVEEETFADDPEDVSGGIIGATSTGEEIDVGETWLNLEKTRLRVHNVLGVDQRTAEVLRDITGRQRLYAKIITDMAGDDAVQGAALMGISIAELSDPIKVREARQFHREWKKSEQDTAPVGVEYWGRFTESYPQFSKWLIETTVGKSGKTLSQSGRMPNMSQIIPGMEQWNQEFLKGDGNKVAGMVSLTLRKPSAAEVRRVQEIQDARGIAKRLARDFQNPAIADFFAGAQTPILGTIRRKSVEWFGGNYPTAEGFKKATTEMLEAKGDLARLRLAIVRASAGTSQTATELASVLQTLPEFGKSAEENLVLIQQTEQQLSNLSPGAVALLQMEMGSQINLSDISGEEDKETRFKQRIEIDNLRFQSVKFLTSAKFAETAMKRAKTSPAYRNELNRVLNLINTGKDPSRG